MYFLAKTHAFDAVLAETKKRFYMRSLDKNRSVKRYALAPTKIQAQKDTLTRLLSFCMGIHPCIRDFYIRRTITSKFARPSQRKLQGGLCFWLHPMWETILMQEMLKTESLHAACVTPTCPHIHGNLPHNLYEATLKIGFQVSVSYALNPKP